MDRVLAHRGFGDWSISLEFKVEDLWIGVFWRRKVLGPWTFIDVWLCLVPMFPIHVYCHRVVRVGQ